MNVKLNIDGIIYEIDGYKYNNIRYKIYVCINYKSLDSLLEFSGGEGFK